MNFEVFLSLLQHWTLSWSTFDISRDEKKRRM
jgi:hypothetical protein